MPFDGIVVRSVTHALQKLVSGRLTRIYQPNPYDLLLHIRSNGKNHKLLISINASFARLHLTKASYDNPKEPTMFCMLLRKHLEGSFLENLSQVGCERIIQMDFRTRNELGDLTIKRLNIELMGRHSNVILVEKDTGLIIDSMKHISSSVNRYRTILPGQDYINPPSQGKKDPLNMTSDDLLRSLDFNAGKLDQQLTQSITGFSPVLSKEILFRAGLPTTKAIVSAFKSIQDDIIHHHDHPQIIYSKEGQDTFHVIDLTHIKGNKLTFDDVNDMLDQYYLLKAENDLVKQRAGDLKHFISNELKKNQHKRKKLEKTLKISSEAKTYQLYGELLTAHMHLIHRGDKSIEVVNYYDENQAKLTIPLNPNRTPSENAQAFFKKYTKAKTANIIVKKQLELTDREIQYFESLLQQIDSASLKDIEEIRSELEDGGYLKKRKQKKANKPAKRHRPELERYTASDGTPILVGKNNIQNDYLTMKVGKSDEIWLHTKDIPGSHVVIQNTDPSDETIEEAARLAAFFSKSRLSSQVPVDYTHIRHVRKPNGAKPGFVIYDHQKTLYVTPDESLVLKLKNET
ncbi:Rqc2 family fibronectin-binding protein [Terrilactibacillus laevilacticus]|uniref:Rqc2 homolog RqcH n=1 Tax=Terrilactibacillus laevilacticus TaxID=1380157 RepID=A0ABW5PPY9_9BACI|nr:NFACT RNA binding domain-containing protein [Terrilactibacillus laevilacticus]